MRSLIRLATTLYPRAWRDRYGEELEALLDDTGVTWRIAIDVFGGAVVMQFQQWQKLGTAALLAIVGVFAASWRAGQRPFLTPGTHQVYRMDSTPGALLEFLVILALAVAGMMTLAKVPRAGRVLGGIAGLYMGSVLV